MFYVNFVHYDRCEASPSVTRLLLLLLYLSNFSANLLLKIFGVNDEFLLPPPKNRDL